MTYGEPYLRSEHGIEAKHEDGKILELTRYGIGWGRDERARGWFYQVGTDPTFQSHYVFDTANAAIQKFCELWGTG